MKKRMKKFDSVNFPSHYNQGDIQCIDAIKAIWFLNKLKEQYD